MESLISDSNRSISTLAITTLLKTGNESSVERLMIIRDIPDAKETGLGHLCEFIEDCEFTYLSTQILSLLGKEAPKTQDPPKYIRYIYNRVILENATVRAAA